MEAYRRADWRLVGPLTCAIFTALTAILLTWIFARPLAVLVLSITIGDAFSPIVHHLERWTKRSIAAIIVYLAIFGVSRGESVSPHPHVVGWPNYKGKLRR